MLRELFAPVQPAVNSRSLGVLYNECYPNVALSKYIYCYWQLKTINRLSAPFLYRVIPDGCIDIFFDVNKPDDLRVMGFSTAHTSFPLDLHFHYAGIRFMPGAFPVFFNVDASELTNRDENLNDVVPEIAKQLTLTLEGHGELGKIKLLLDEYFLKKMEDLKTTGDKRLYGAILTILKARGSLNIESGLDIGLSPRQLRRLFDFYIGHSPKMFSKVIRFQYFLQLLSSATRHEYNKLFLEAGYYDQPHFNKDFKTFFGLTPTDALKAS